MKETDHPPGPGWLARWVPAASWLPRYQRGWLAGDAIAGFTIWGLLIPEMIAGRGPSCRRSSPPR